MFFKVTLQRYLRLSPSTFGPGFNDVVLQTLLHEIEGKPSGNHGIVVAITSSHVIGKPQIEEGTSFAIVSLSFDAIVCKPFRGEVLDAIVSQVNKVGFFAMAGPIKIFVSNKLIPSEMNFNPESIPPCFISDDQTISIEIGNQIRLKVVGVRNQANEIISIGTINEQYLGRLL